MKERNFKRKQALKRAKESRECKKALHEDIADFMVNTHICLIPQPVGALKHFLQNGWKGYYQMRGRQLVGLFEEESKRLHSNTTMIFYKKRSQWADDLTEDRVRAKDKESFDLRQIFILQADALMNRLIELAFDLDFDE